jgi:hypothetical protein
MSFTLNHLKIAQDNLLQGDQLRAMKELNILIERYEHLHNEQRRVIELYQQQHPETQENENGCRREG